jgi:hypothetical protein
MVRPTNERPMCPACKHRMALARIRQSTAPGSCRSIAPLLIKRFGGSERKLDVLRSCRARVAYPFFVTVMRERHSQDERRRRAQVGERTGSPDPVGRSNSPGYGHLKLPHLMTTGRAAELRRVKQDVYFRSLQLRRGWGVERLETTAAKHSIHVT